MQMGVGGWLDHQSLGEEVAGGNYSRMLNNSLNVAAAVGNIKGTPESVVHHLPLNVLKVEPIPPAVTPDLQGHVGHIGKNFVAVLPIQTHTHTYTHRAHTHTVHTHWCRTGSYRHASPTAQIIAMKCRK